MAREARGANADPHDRLILEQFTRQAVPFNSARALTDVAALESIVRACAPRPEDEALDIACGGGIVACALAPHVRTVTGIDMTPAMLDRARSTATEKGCGNTRWIRGLASPLPFADNAFAIVVTRYSFHHFLDPLSVLREMVRVCKPRGRIVVVDMYASEAPSQAAEWNRLETLRDPSHVRVLPLSELSALYPAAGLPRPAVSFYDIRDSVKNLLGRSFPNPGDEQKIWALFSASVRDGRLGIETSVVDGELRYAYPTAILAASRPGASA